MKRQRILFYRIGSLGDSVVSLPALWTIKRNFPDAACYLLEDRQVGNARVSGSLLFEGSGIFVGEINYAVDSSLLGRFLKPVRLFVLLWRLRRGRFDAVAYLAPSARKPEQVARDRFFFRLAGIKRMFGAAGFKDGRASTMPPPREDREADQILGRLVYDGLTLPAPGDGSFELFLGPTEEHKVAAWLTSLPPDGGRDWMGLGPSTKQPATLWPEERFTDVVARLIVQRDIWPVVFGGAEDRDLGDRLILIWGRGYNACGALGLREAASALKHCRLYLGNDSGTLHLAASVGVACVGIYSAHNAEGKWEPYGPGHLVFRKKIDCEGCGLMVCNERRNECILAVQVDEVAEGCGRMLSAAKVGPGSSVREVIESGNASNDLYCHGRGMGE